MTLCLLPAEIFAFDRYEVMKPVNLKAVFI